MTDLPTRAQVHAVVDRCVDQINELTALVDPGPSMSGTRADELNAVLLSAVKAVTAYERAIYDDGALVRD